MGDQSTQFFLLWQPLPPPLLSSISFLQDLVQTELYCSRIGSIYSLTCPSGTEPIHRRTKSWQIQAWKNMLTSPWQLPETLPHHKCLQVPSKWKLDLIYLRYFLGGLNPNTDIESEPVSIWWISLSLMWWLTLNLLYAIWEPPEGFQWLILTGVSGGVTG